VRVSSICALTNCWTGLPLPRPSRLDPRWCKTSTIRTGSTCSHRLRRPLRPPSRFSLHPLESLARPPKPGTFIGMRPHVVISGIPSCFPDHGGDKTTAGALHHHKNVHIVDDQVTDDWDSFETNLDGALAQLLAAGLDHNNSLQPVARRISLPHSPLPSRALEESSPPASPNCTSLPAAPFIDRTIALLSAHSNDLGCANTRTSRSAPACASSLNTSSSIRRPQRPKAAVHAPCRVAWRGSAQCDSGAHAHDERNERHLGVLRDCAGRGGAVECEAGVTDNEGDASP
jgi:hypothetical protein